MEWTTTWHGNGQIESQCQVTGDDGQPRQRHGLARGWHECGTLAWECVYDRGIERGIERHWYPDGTRNAQFSHDGDGQRCGLSEIWHPNGELMLREVPLVGRFRLCGRWKADGSLEAEGILNGDGRRVGFWRFWNIRDSGILQERLYDDDGDETIRQIKNWKYP